MFRTKLSHNRLFCPDLALGKQMVRGEAPLIIKIDLLAPCTDANVGALTLSAAPGTKKLGSLTTTRGWIRSRVTEESSVGRTIPFCQAMSIHRKPGR